jgi:hypothetical protein
VAAVAALAQAQAEAGGWNPANYALGHRVAQALQELEGGFDFSGADAVPGWGVAALTIAYYLLQPALLVGALVIWFQAPSVRPLRLFTGSLAAAYALALPFHLVLPVPERWAFPGSGAMLLSDRWGEGWIRAARLWSSPDDGFPSLHAALAAVVVIVAYAVRARWRHVVLCLGLLAGSSSFFLGLTWLPGLAMGVAVAGLAFALAVRWSRAWYPEEWPVPRAVVSVGDPPPSGPGPRWTDTAFPFLRPGRQRRVFISYRRDGASDLARVVRMELERRGYPCFLDVDDVGAGRFDARLLREIEAAPNFVLVLAAGSLDRCREPDDWLRREIAHAVRYRRRIVPLVAEGFQFPPDANFPPEVARLAGLNAVVYSHAYFGASFDRLEEFLRAPPPGAA